MQPTRHGVDMMKPTRHGVDMMEPTSHGVDMMDPTRHNDDMMEPTRHGVDMIELQLQDARVPTGDGWECVLKDSGGQFQQGQPSNTQQQAQIPHTP